MKVSEYCTRNVVYIGINESPLDAARLMREKNVGCVVIVNEETTKLVPVGILTDRDIAIEIVAEEVDPSAVTVLDVFCGTLITVNAQDDLDESLNLMMRKGVRRVPVVDYDGALIGIIAIDDYLEMMAEQLYDLVDVFKKASTKEVIKEVHMS